VIPHTVVDNNREVSQDFGLKTLQGKHLSERITLSTKVQVFTASKVVLKELPNRIRDLHTGVADLMIECARGRDSVGV